MDLTPVNKVLYLFIASGLRSLGISSFFTGGNYCCIKLLNILDKRLNTILLLSLNSFYFVCFVLVIIIIIVSIKTIIG